jgi:hypothetical protein
MMPSLRDMYRIILIVFLCEAKNIGLFLSVEKVGSLEEECVSKRMFARGAMSAQNWKRKKYKEVRLGGVNRSLSAVAYLGNGALLATLADDGTLSLYDLNYSTKPIQQLSHLGNLSIYILYK